MPIALVEKPGHLSIALTMIVALASYTVYAIRSPYKQFPCQSRKIIPSPRMTLLPYLSKEQVDKLVYPPDILPGGRNVSTPWGLTRVYEWGSQTGRRVLFLHGDGTPSPLFRPIADVLVARGCRVMLLDLWGRGYTDTPADIQHNNHLFNLQILHALLSSPIAWGTSAPFSLVGFSMGGGLAMDFFAHYPSMVEGLILLNPGGLIRELPSTYRSIWYQYPSLVSKSTLRRLIGILIGDQNPSTSVKTVHDVGVSDTGFTPSEALKFQFDYHHGHVLSFLSTIRYAPLQHQSKTWKLAGDILKKEDSNEGVEISPLSGKKILCLSGKDDAVCVPEHIKESLNELIGPEHADFKVVPGDHYFLWEQGPDTARLIMNYWGWS